MKESSTVNKFLAWLKTEPTVIVQLLQAALAIAVTSHLLDLSDDQTTGLLATATAVLGVVNGLSVRPFRWPAVVGFAQTIFLLLASFGWNASADFQGAVVTLVSLVGTVLIRQAVTPETKRLPVAQDSLDL